MRKYLPAVAVLTALVLTNCQPQASSTSPNGPLAATDFENLDGWLPDSPTGTALSRDRAHSGKFSTKVDGAHEFSLGYNNSLSTLSPEWPGKITISAWVLLLDEQHAPKLVAEVKGPGNSGPSLLWAGLDLGQQAKVSNKWYHVEQTITLPETAKPNSRLLVYMWRADSQQPAYLDDVQISLAK